MPAMLGTAAWALADSSTILRLESVRRDTGFRGFVFIGIQSLECKRAVRGYE